MSLLDTFLYSELLGGSNILPVTKPITVLTGQTLLKGTVMAKVAEGAVSETHAGNTGNGVMGAMTRGKNAKVGVYALLITAAATNAGTFELRDPDDISVGRGTVGVAFTSSHLNFTLADGATDFVVGDKFLITVAAGSLKYVAVDSTRVDGGEDPLGVLPEDVDSTAGDKGSTLLCTGEFIEDRLIFVHSGDTIATFRDVLEAKQIFARTFIAP